MHELSNHALLDIHYQVYTNNYRLLSKNLLQLSIMFIWGICSGGGLNSFRALDTRDTYTCQADKSAFL